MSSYRSIYQAETPGAARSGQRKHILPFSILVLILIISAISAIVLLPQQASASTRVSNVDCTAYVSATLTVPATCGDNIISKPCHSNNVIGLVVVTGRDETHWVCYGGALGGRETHGHNGGTVTFNPPILVGGINPDNWSGYLASSVGSVPFYNEEPQNYGTRTYIVVKALVVSDDSI